MWAAACCSKSLRSTSRLLQCSVEAMLTSHRALAGHTKLCRGQGELPSKITQQAASACIMSRFHHRCPDWCVRGNTATSKLYGSVVHPYLDVESAGKLTSTAASDRRKLCDKWTRRRSHTHASAPEHIYAPTASAVTCIVTCHASLSQIYFPVLHCGEPALITKLFSSLLRDGGSAANCLMQYSLCCWSQLNWDYLKGVTSTASQIKSAQKAKNE